MRSSLFDPREHSNEKSEDAKQGNNPPEADDRRYRHIFRHAIDLALKKLKPVPEESIAEEED